MDIEKVSAKKLKPAKYNPRKDLKPGDKEYKKLQRSIETFGYVEPIIWNKRTGNVVGGHQRLKVLTEMGEKEIECVVVDVSEKEEKILNVSLNKNRGLWDYEKLKELLDELDQEVDGIGPTGFEDWEVDNLLVQYDHITELWDEGFSEWEQKEEPTTFVVSFVIPPEEQERVREYLANNEEAKSELSVAVLDRVKGDA